MQPTLGFRAVIPSSFSPFPRLSTMWTSYWIVSLWNQRMKRKMMVF